MARDFRDDVSDEVAIGNALVINRGSRVIHFSKPQLAPEDIVALSFARVLENAGIEYVVVAEYVAILFGRARRSDDVDFVLRDLGEEGFVELCSGAREAGFTLMQADIESEESVRRVYREYLAEGYSVRFMYRDIIVPSVEAKLAKTSVHRHALNNGFKVVMNNQQIVRISPLELQIAYKLHLGSDKDIGDAVFLYTLFREAISLEELYTWCKRLRADCNVLLG